MVPENAGTARRVIQRVVAAVAVPLLHRPYAWEAFDSTAAAAADGDVPDGDVPDAVDGPAPEGDAPGDDAPEAAAGAGDAAVAAALDPHRLARTDP